MSDRFSILLEEKPKRLKEPMANRFASLLEEKPEAYPAPTEYLRTKEVPEVLGEIEKRKPIGFSESIRRAGPWGVTKRLPFIGSSLEAMRNIEIGKAAKRLQAEPYEQMYAQPREQWTMHMIVNPSPVHLRKSDEKFVTEYFNRLEEESKRDKTFWAKVGSGVMDLAPWMIEFYTTGGLSRLSSTGTRKFGEKLLGQYAKSKAGQLALRGAGWGVGAAARTTVGLPGRVAERYARRRLPKELTIGREGQVSFRWPKEKQFTSFAKAWGSVFIEAASEEAGEVISGRLFGEIRSLPFGSKFLTTLRKAWTKLAPENTASKFWRQIFSRAGYSNLIGEIGEERLATLMHTIAKTEDFGAGKDANVIERLTAGFTQDVKNFPVEAAVLSVPGITRAAVSRLGPRIPPRERVPPVPEEPTPVKPGLEGIAEELPEVKAPEKAEIPPTEAIPAPEQAIQPQKPAEAAELPPTAEIEHPAEKVQASFSKYKKAMPKATEQEIVEALIEDGLRPPKDMLKKYDELPSVQRILEQDEIDRAVKRAAEAKITPAKAEVAIGDTVKIVAKPSTAHLTDAAGKTGKVVDIQMIRGRPSSWAVDIAGEEYIVDDLKDLKEPAKVEKPSKDSYDIFATNLERKGAARTPRGIDYKIVQPDAIYKPNEYAVERVIAGKRETIVGTRGEAFESKAQAMAWARSDAKQRDVEFKGAEEKALKEIKEKEIEYEEKAITEPTPSPKVEPRKAGKIVPTGKLDPTNAKEALEIIRLHKLHKGGVGGIFEQEWDTKGQQYVITSVEYTSKQVDAAYRTVQKPIESPMPDTELFVMPGKEAQMKAIAQKMAKVKGVIKPKKKGLKPLTKPTALPKVAKDKEGHVKAVFAAAAKESERYAITGVKVEGDVIVATDGHRLFWAKGKWGKDGLYLDAASLKKGLLGKLDKTGQKFPMWRDIVPDVSDQKPILVDLEAALSHVRQAAIITTEESKGITIIENKDERLGLGFAAAAPEVGHAEINVYSGGRILGSVNPQFLLDAIKFHAIRGDTTIEFYFKNWDRPILTRSLDGKTSTITMPINVGEPTEAIKEAISEWPTKAKPKEKPPAQVKPVEAPKKVEVKEPELPIKVSPDDVNYRTAVNAYSNVSHTPEKRARSTQQEYVSHIKGIYEDLKPYAKSETQKIILKDELERYRKNYLEKLNAYLHASSRTASSFIVGPAKFPVRQMEKRHATVEKRLNEWINWQKKAQKSIKKNLLEARTPEEKRATIEHRLKKDFDRNIEIIKSIDAGEEFYNRSAFVNSMVGKIRRLIANRELETAETALNYIKKAQEGMKKPIFSSRHGIWSELEKAKAQKPEIITGEKTIKIYKGAEIINNYDAERVQLIFDEKPSDELRKELKSNGWHWSPSNNAWQRKNTKAAIADSQRILDKYFKKPPAKVKPKGVPSKVGFPARPSPEEMPTAQANAYEKPADITEEANKEITDIKKTAKVRPGFARIPSLAEFQELSSRMRKGFAKLNEPQKDFITDAAGAVEKWRAETNKAGLYADWSKMTLRKVGATNKELNIVDRYLDNPKKYKDEFDKLPDKVKQMGHALQKDYEDMRKLAEKEGMLETWVENYTPHMYRDNQTRLIKTLYPLSGKLGKKFRFGKQRVFKTLDEAEAAGLHPITDPILKNSVYKYQFYKTIANRNLIELLKNMKREDGMQLIMGRPRLPWKREIWENDYALVNVPGLQRFLYVGEVAEKPMLIRTSVKADPEVAQILNNAFAPWTPRGNWMKGYLWLRGRVKRIIMYNPLIHSWNIWSDVFDEVNFNPYSLVKVQVRGKKLYKEKDALVERAVAAGLNIQAGFGIARDLRKAMGETEAWKRFFMPLSKLEKWSDEHLWQGTVRSAQIGLFETLTKAVAKENPEWSQVKVDKVVTTHINTLLGTLPHTWFTEWGRKASSIALFARNWTVSNIDLVVRAVTGGRKGLGVKALSRDQQKQLGKMNAKHLAKGVFGLVVLANLLQLGFLLITNALKKKKIIKGEQTPLHTTFQNESWKHWIDVDTGLKTRKGQVIYLVPPFFRYIRDYWGYATQPARTIYNKFEPIAKNFAEVLVNYSVWQSRRIAQKGAPTWVQLKDRALYFIKGITPSSMYAGRPGYVPTWFEWAIPFSGTWIRRGAPGGKFTRMMWDFRSKEGYKRSELDKKIDESLQKRNFKDALTLMLRNQRYKTEQGMTMRIMETVAPLNYYWETTPKTERVKYMKYLEGKGYKINWSVVSNELKKKKGNIAMGCPQLAKELIMERIEIGIRED